jgi:hypothetical protein
MLKRFKRMFQTRLVAITVARDEEDVIEAFVRHTAALVDHHLIVDHCSHDRTAEILARLAGEGLSISVFRCDDPVYNQPPLTNLLMRRAVEEHDADWVVPLDADEFVMPAFEAEGEPSDILREGILHAPSNDGCLIYPFRTFHPTETDPKAQLNVVERIGQRFKWEIGEHHKIIVNRKLASTEGGQIMPGNHHFNLGDQQVSPQALEDIVISHYPVRSLGQFIRKIATAELGKDSFGKKRKGLGTQKTAPFELLKAEPHRFCATALEPDRGLIERPGQYFGEALRYTRAQDEFAATVSSLLSTSHEIARQLGAMRDGQREKGADPLKDTASIKLTPIDAIEEEAPAYIPRRIEVAEKDEVLHF